MRRISTLAAVLGAGVLAGCGGSGSSAPTFTTLVSRASQLKVNSLAFTTTSSVPGTAGAAETTVNGTARLTLHPALAGTLTFTTAGQTINERIVGSSIYAEIPAIAARDGGRPWVRIDLSAASSAVGINLTELLQEEKSADPTTTMRLLAAKGIFHQTATATIDGQRVAVLVGSFTPATLTSPVLSADLVAQVKAKLAQVGATHEAVTTYLAYSGLPVRIVTTLTTSTRGTITSTVDFRDINVPVTAAAPPAAQTVTLAELKKLGG